MSPWFRLLLLMAVAPVLAVPSSSQARAHCRPTLLYRVIGGQVVERATLRLTQCDGTPNPTALDELSLLARPHGLARPTEQQMRHFRRTTPRPAADRYVHRGIRRVNAGLLTRLAAISARWPQRAIQILSGLKVGRGGRHHEGLALDIRMRGIRSADLSEYARVHLHESGVGHYPREASIHIDVRNQSDYWENNERQSERHRAKETRANVMLLVQEALGKL